MSAQTQTVGIIGAGKLGIVLAQLATRAGYRTLISGSGDVAKIALTVEVLAPEANATTTTQVAAQADIVILALPLGKVTKLVPTDFAHKLVIDATNHWWEVDGQRDTILPATQSSSEFVQAHLYEAHVVKALNHMGYHDLYDEARREPSAQKAIAIAGDRSNEVGTVEALVRSLGFDTLRLDSLRAGIVLEPGNPTFGANVSKPELAELIAQAQAGQPEADLLQ